MWAMFGQNYSSGQKVLQKQQGLGQIWISGYEFAHDIQKLKSLNIYGVCSGVDLKHTYPQQFIHLKFDLDDDHKQDVRQAFQPAYQFIEQTRKKTNVLVHCAAGISRCSTLLISYMMKKYNWPYDQCLNIIKKSRDCCQPNMGFVKQLKQYQKKLGIVPSKPIKN